MATHTDTLRDKIERLIFGASAKVVVELRMRLAEQRLAQRLLAALEADDTDADSDNNNGGGEGKGSADTSGTFGSAVIDSRGTRISR